MDKNMKKVYVNVKTRLIIEMDEGIEVAEVLDNMDYNFTSNNDEAEITDTEIKDYEVIDSK
jgi:hypothetical protein